FKKGDKFFLYFANIIKSMHKKVYNGVFYGKEFNLKDKNLIDVFNDYFYSFLENESIDLYEIKTDEEIRYNFKAFIDKCEIANDYWTNSPHTVAKGIFSFAYITEQIKSILLERSIGDKWEKFLKDNLGEEKIDFQNREIEWDKLNDEDIKFLSRILLQFVTRKNPSPARFRRIWESTKEFLMNVENDMMDILKLKEGRNIRIKWESIIHEEKHKGKDFEYKGLHFKSDKHGNLYLLSSTEKAVSILSKYKDKEKAYNHILKENTGWLKDKIIEITNLNDNSKCKIELNNPRNIPYKPYLSIINPTPISWQFIVPAEHVTDIIKETQKRYYKEYKYVMGKLPLHIGVVFQDYKKPLYIGIKALRNIRRDVDDWDSLKSNITGKQLQKVFEKNIDDDRLNYYSIYPLNEDNGCIKDKKHIKEFYSIYIKAEDVLYKFKSVNNVKKGEEYIVYHNTIDFEYLDVNTRRNDIYYDITNSKRAKSIVKYKQNRPYTWEEWKSFDKFEEYFNNNKIRIKLQTIINLIYSKLEDWQGCQNDTLNRFMLSAFVNTFELKDVTSKNDFAKMLGNDSWSELENLCNQKFIKELYMFIDMYEFWHNGLKKI
ncbi:hypothetical protein, partial [Schnuerera sp.]|uniref:hypothetical protein n=1 Tax=Schnuerera sp. TaxID=2794844 RepID=UPI002CC03922